MLDIKYIRENKDLVRTALQNKRVNLDLDELLSLDAEVLELKKRVQALQEEKNANAKKMPKATPEERPALIERGRAVGQEISKIEPELALKEEGLKNLLWLTPLVPASDVPVGKDDSENVERKKGESFLPSISPPRIMSNWPCRTTGLSSSVWQQCAAPA